MAAYLKAPERGAGVAERLVRVGLLDDLQIGEGRLVRHGVTPFYVVRLDARAGGGDLGSVHACALHPRLRP